MKALLVVAATALMVSIPAFASHKLAEQNGCLECHLLDRKTVGPAYEDVAKKYAHDIGAAERLFIKVKEGGWAYGVTRPCHPTLK